MKIVEWLKRRDPMPSTWELLKSIGIWSVIGAILVFFGFFLNIITGLPVGYIFLVPGAIVTGIAQYTLCAVMVSFLWRTFRLILNLSVVLIMKFL